MKRTGQVVAIATELGLTMGVMTALLVVGGLVLGRWIDNQLGSSPIATMACLLLGAILGQVMMIRMAKSASAEMRASSAAPDTLPVMPAREPIRLARKALALMIVPAVVGFVVGYGAMRLLGTDTGFTVLLVIFGVFVGVVLTVFYARR